MQKFLKGLFGGGLFRKVSEIPTKRDAVNPTHEVTEAVKIASKYAGSQYTFLPNRKGATRTQVRIRTNFEKLVDETVAFNKEFNKTHPHDKRPTSVHKVRKKLQQVYKEESQIA